MGKENTSKPINSRHETIFGQIRQGRWRDLSTILTLLFIVVGIVGIGGAILIEEHILDWHPIIGHISRDLGIAALVAGVIGLVSDVWLKTDFIGIIVNSLERVYEKRQRFSEAGLKKTHERLDPDLLRERCNKSAKIRILQTWLGHDRETIRAIRQAANRGCEVEILLLDPFSAQVPYRASALKMDGKIVMDNLSDQLTALCQISSERQDDGKDNVHVRVYDTAPTVQIYEFDRTKLIGMYWRKRYTVEGPQFEIVDSETSPLATTIDEHFEDLWEDKSTRAASEAMREYQHWQNTSLTLAKLTLEEHWYWKSTGLTLEEFRNRRNGPELPEKGRGSPPPI